MMLGLALLQCSKSDSSNANKSNKGDTSGIISISNLCKKRNILINGNKWNQLKALILSHPNNWGEPPNAEITFNANGTFIEQGGGSTIHGVPTYYGKWFVDSTNEYFYMSSDDGNDDTKHYYKSFIINEYYFITLLSHRIHMRT